MTDEVRLGYEQYLDMLHMLAHDQADPEDVVNPPARIRVALSREQRRNKRLDLQRFGPLAEQEETLEDASDLESEVLVNMDWDRAKHELGVPADQAKAVEARINGASLQSTDVSIDLGWGAAYAAKVRRSLEPDRRWGKKLRRYFSSYRPEDRRP